MGEINLTTNFLNNSLGNYLLSLLFLAAFYFIIKLFDKFLLDHLNLLIKRFSLSFSKLLKKIIKKRVYPLLYILAFFLAFRQLEIMPQVDKFINFVLMILSVIFVVFMILDVISYSLKKYWHKKERTDEQQKVLTVSFFLIKILVWLLALIFILDNLDIELTALITGLGVSGIAIAFAAQTILTDLFNYFTIFFDKPFDIGDYIATGEYRGTIEHIGVKTTRIRSLTGEQLVISNTDLVNSRINNYKRMERRRINFSFGLTYDTPLTELKKVKKIIEEIIKSIDQTEFDRAHFAEYAASSLLFQVVYYVEDNDYKVYMDIQEEINFRLKEEIEALGLHFAFPTQTVHLAEKQKRANNFKEKENLNVSS